jgi:hypothetical protein
MRKYANTVKKPLTAHLKFSRCLSPRNEGKPVDDPAEALRHLEEAWSRFREKILPVLRALQL